MSKADSSDDIQRPCFAGASTHVDGMPWEAWLAR